MSFCLKSPVWPLTLADISGLSFQLQITGFHSLSGAPAPDFLRLAASIDRADLIFVTSIAALFLQLMHSLISAGLRDRRKSKSSSRNVRWLRTLFFLDLILYGSESDKRRVVEWLRKIHRPITGRLGEDINHKFDRESTYGFSFELQQWVLGTIAWCMVQYHQATGTPLHPAARDLIVAELMMISRRLGAPLKGLPMSWDQLRQTFAKQLDELSSCQGETNRGQMEALLCQIRSGKNRGLRWLNILALLLSFQVLPTVVAEQIYSSLTKLERFLIPVVWTAFRFALVILRNVPVRMLVALVVRLDPIRLQKVLDRTREEIAGMKIDTSQTEEDALFGARERLSLMWSPSSTPPLHVRCLQTLQTSISSFFCEAVRKEIDIEKLPVHLGVIMDGNRRFAQSEQIPIGGGHAQGANKLRDVAMWSFGNGIPALTAWGFSSDNFKRSEKEQAALFTLMARELHALRYSGMVHAWNVRVVIIGDKSKLPKPVQEAAQAVEEETLGYGSHQLILALNYGGHDEIVDMAKRVQDAGLPLTKASMSQMTETARHGIRPVDVILRTSGELRTSGFLLWESLGAELAFVKTCWPALSELDFLTTLVDVSSRNIRRGA